MYLIILDFEVFVRSYSRVSQYIMQRYASNFFGYCCCFSWPFAIPPLQVVWGLSTSIPNLFWVPSCTVPHTCEQYFSMAIFLRHCSPNNIRAKWAFQHSQVLGINQRAATVDPIQVYFGGCEGATAPSVSILVCLSMCVFQWVCIYDSKFRSQREAPSLLCGPSQFLSFFFFPPPLFLVSVGVCLLWWLPILARGQSSSTHSHTHTHTDRVFWHTAQTKPHWSSPWHNSRDEVTALTSVWTHVTNTHKQEPAERIGIVVLHIIIIIISVIVSMASPHRFTPLPCCARS